MFEIFKSNPEFSLSVFSFCVLGLAYIYKDRKENKRNQKLALYALIEIWYRMSFLYKDNFDAEIDQMFYVIKSRYPKENISEEYVNIYKKNLAPFLKETATRSAFSDLDGYERKYQEAIDLISAVDPIFAYKISAVNTTKKALSMIDDYVSESVSVLDENGEMSERMMEKLKVTLISKVKNESLIDLEDSLKELSKKIGWLSYFSCLKAIKKRKNYLETVDNEEVEKNVDELLIPFINEAVAAQNSATDGVEEDEQ